MAVSKSINCCSLGFGGEQTILRSSMGTLLADTAYSVYMWLGL